MLIEEKFTVKAPREKVWAFLMNPKSLAPCVPGCEKVKAIDEKNFLVTVKMKIAFISLAFNMKVEITEMSPPVHLETSATGEESSMTSNIKAKNVIDLTSLSDRETEVSYRSEVSLFGKLGTMGQSVVKGKAKQVGKEFAEAVRKRLESKA